MERRDRWGRWGRRTWLAAAALTLGPAIAGSGHLPSNVRLAHNSERFAVTRALGGAARMLGDPECQVLLDEFNGAAGRPLRAALEATGLRAPEYLDGVFFYDAPQRLCEASALAVTMPGSRAVLVCGSRFVRQMETNSPHAEAILVHEALHSLGLGENPPSSDYITERIRALCE